MTIMKVRHLIRNSFKSISPNSGTLAVKDLLFSEKFLVVEDDSGYVGILTPYDLAKHSFKLVADCLTNKKRIVDNQDISSVLDIMTASHEPALPVFSDERFLGVILRSDIIDFLNEETRILEAKVQDRTKELEQANRRLHVEITERKQIEQELMREKKNLEEVNSALKIILRENESRKTEVEERIFLNIEKLLLPSLNELISTNLSEKQQFLLDVIQKNIKEITSSFSRDLIYKYNNLTPKEIQIANLIKQGLTNKEIAKFLSVSSSAVVFHRQNIRKKLNIRGKKKNLRSVLLEA